MNHASPQRAPSRHHGFSLVEILVAVAIIAILSALLFPAVKEQIRKSRQAKLAGNMKTIAGGVMMYAADSERIPASSQPGDSWQFIVMKYLGQELTRPEQYRNSVFHDPLDTEIMTNGSTKRASLNIALNGMATFKQQPDGSYTEPEPTGASYRKLTSIAQPSRLLLMTTGERNYDAYSGYTMRLNSNAFRGNADVTKLTRIPGYQMCCFVDGHVELVPITDILKEVEKDRTSISTSVFFDAKANNGQGPN